MDRNAAGKRARLPSSTAEEVQQANTRLQLLSSRAKESPLALIRDLNATVAELQFIFTRCEAVYHDGICDALSVCMDGRSPSEPEDIVLSKLEEVAMKLCRYNPESDDPWVCMEKQPLLLTTATLHHYLRYVQRSGRQGVQVYVGPRKGKTAFQERLSYRLNYH